MANIVIGEVDSSYARNSCLYLWLERVEPTSASITGNYTDTTWEAGVWIGSNNEWYNNAIKIYSVYINGTKVWAGGTFSNISGNGYHKLGSGTARIYHNDNGSKSFSASISGWFYGSGDKSGSKTFSLPTIPRVSDLSVNKTSVPADNNTTVIATVTPKADFTDVLTVSLGGYSKDIKTGVAFTIPDEWINDIPSTSAVAKVKVETFNGTTSIGSNTVDLTITVPEDVKPVINAINISEAVEAVTNAFGNRYVQSRSQLNVSVDVTEAYGSSIGEYITTIENVSYNGQAFESNILQRSGTLEIATKVTDGRGRTDEKTETINVVEYALPTIADVTCVQGNVTDAGFVQNSNGDCTKVTIAGAVSSVEEQNTKTLKLYYKKTTDEKPTERIVSVSDWTFSVDVIINNTDPSMTYEYVAELTDKTNAGDPERYPITTGIVVISRLAGGKGVTLFKEAENEGFWVGDVDYTITAGEFETLVSLLGGGGAAQYYN